LINPSKDLREFSMTFRHALQSVHFSCLLDPKATATVTVVDNPFCTQTDRAGMYRLADLPPGSYRLRAYHPRWGHVERSIFIKGDRRAVRVDFEFEPVGK
jgi:hypothetical protein